MAGRTRLILLDLGVVFAALINEPDGPEIHDGEAEALTSAPRSSECPGAPRRASAVPSTRIVPASRCSRTML